MANVQRRRVHRARRLAAPLMALWAGAWLACSGGDSVDVTPPPTPVIQSVSGTVLSVGDTLEMKGRDFATPAGSNRVVFNNTLAMATPFFAAADSLAVVVPQNANSGPLHVTSLGVNSAPVSVEILRSVGDVWVVGGGANYSFKVPAPAGAEYLIVAHSANATGSKFNYSVSPDTTSAFPAPAPAPSRARAGATTLPLRFEGDIRRQAFEHIERHGRGRPAVTASRAPAAGAPPDTTTFFVLKCTQCSTIQPSSYAKVTAALRYTGNNVLIYSDVKQPTGSFTQVDYDALGLQFDMSIFPTDTLYFGPPTDIDGNPVIALFTPVVNDLTPDGTAASGFISGFFLFNDLAPNIFPAGTSNGTEIFYAMVPDPNAEYGNQFQKADVLGIIPSTLAHELEHMISFGHRFLVVGNGTNVGFTQTTWLEEGMAHMAEDLNNMNGQNVLRANRYLAAPNRTSLMGNVELQPFIDTLEQRGAVYLFLRYLGDQLGEGIYKSIVQSACIGRPCIQNVTGEGFFTTVSDFLATLYLSDRAITLNPKYNYSSFNFQQTFAPLLVNQRTVGGGPFGQQVRSASGDYYTVSGASSPAIRFAVSDSQNGQIRAVVVRTKGN